MTSPRHAERQGHDACSPNLARYWVARHEPRSFVQPAPDGTLTSSALVVGTSWTRRRVGSSLHIPRKVAPVDYAGWREETIAFVVALTEPGKRPNEPVDRPNQRHEGPRVDDGY